MRTLLILLFMTIGLSSFCQYPMTDNFTAIGGANQWYAVTGVGYTTSGIGIDGGNLCYNVSGAYSKNKRYSFQSPDYGTKFSTDLCDSISVTFKITIDIRTQDQMQFWVYYMGSWHGYLISSSGTYGVNLPKTSNYFSFDLVTGDDISGSVSNNYRRDGKYVHIDYITIGCYKNVSLPIELISFNGFAEERSNIIKWETLSEYNNDFFTIEKTEDGMNYEIITIVNGAGNSNILLSYSFEEFQPWDMTYYRLKQTDYDGEFVYSDLISVYRPSKNKQILRIINILGQEVNENYDGVKIYYFTDL